MQLPSALSGLSLQNFSGLSLQNFSLKNLLHFSKKSCPEKVFLKKSFSDFQEAELSYISGMIHLEP